MSEFKVFLLLHWLAKAKRPSLPWYLPTAGGITDGFILFKNVLAHCETQTALSKIWTRVANSISSDDNSYTKRIYINNIFIFI